MVNSCHDQTSEKSCGNVDFVTLNNTFVDCASVYVTVQQLSFSKVMDWLDSV